MIIVKNNCCKILWIKWVQFTHVNNNLYFIYKTNNKWVYREIRVALISAKMQENKLRWFSHIQRKTSDALVRRIESIIVKGKRNRGRPRRVWGTNKKWFAWVTPLWGLERDSDGWRRLIYVLDYRSSLVYLAKVVSLDTSLWSQLQSVNFVAGKSFSKDLFRVRGFFGRICLYEYVLLHFFLFHTLIIFSYEWNTIGS